MTNDERMELMMLYVAGALEPAEEAEVRALIASGDPAVMGALAEAEATFHAIPQGLKEELAPAGAWEKIEQRMELSERAGVAAAASEIRPRSGNGGWAMGWAAASVVAIVMGWMWSNTRTELAETRGRLAGAVMEAARAKELELRVVDLERQVGTLRTERGEMLAAFDRLRDGYGLKLASLANAERFAIAGGEMKEARGALFWNKTENRWTVMASHLPQMEKGKSLELWVITDKGQKIAVGGQLPDEKGNAVWDVKLPEVVNGVIAVAAVTDEPAGVVITVPSGKVQFLSKVAGN